MFDWRELTSSLSAHSLLSAFISIAGSSLPSRRQMQTLFIVALADMRRKIPFHYATPSHLTTKATGFDCALCASLKAWTNNFSEPGLSNRFDGTPAVKRVPSTTVFNCTRREQD